MTTNKTLRAAVIGLGIGERHIHSYEADPRCKVVTLCDINEEKLKEVGSRYPHCKLTTSADEVLNDPEIDVVSIASYDTYHAKQVLAAINTNKHIFVEKPLCLNETELEQISEALSKKPDIQLSSNLVLRRAPQFLSVKKKIDSGEMGKLYYLEGDYNYGRLQKITEGWRGDIPFYSVTHGGAIHMIDLILWLSGEKVKSVIANGNALSSEGTKFRYYDTVTALINFESGATAKICANFGSVCPHHHVLSVFGTEASFIHNYQGGAFYHSRDPKAEVEKIHLAFETKAKGDVQKAFVGQILDGNPGEVLVSEVMNAMAVSIAIEKSLETRQWEPIRYVKN